MRGQLAILLAWAVADAHGEEKDGLPRRVCSEVEGANDPFPPIEDVDSTWSPGCWAGGSAFTRSSKSCSCMGGAKKGASAARSSKLSRAPLRFVNGICARLQIDSTNDHSPSRLAWAIGTRPRCSTRSALYLRGACTTWGLFRLASAIDAMLLKIILEEVCATVACGSVAHVQLQRWLPSGQAPCHICTGTGLAPCPHLHRDWAHPCAHLHRDWAHSYRRLQRFRLSETQQHAAS